MDDTTSPDVRTAVPTAGTTAPLPGFHAVVPAGGAGTRLWPLSRAARPKFLLDLTGTGRTLIQATWNRLEPLAGATGMVVVTGAAHAVPVARQLPRLAEDNLVVEPAPRNSAAAIGLAAAVLARRDPEAVIGSFAADHVIADEAVFHAAVTEAVAAAREGWLVTIGITPDFASTGFGYIDPGVALEVAGAPSLRRVEAFVEKPDQATAEEYLRQGWQWNAGMFVVRAAGLMALLAEHEPVLAAGLERIAAAWDTEQREEVLAATWPGLPSVAIDNAVAEPAAEAGRVAVVPGSFGWDDVGDWTSLADLLRPGTDADGVEQEDGGLRVLGDPELVVGRDATGIVVPTGGRLVVVAGVRDVVVVDTLDAVLVTTRAAAQDVKGVVDVLKREGRAHLV